MHENASDTRARHRLSRDIFCCALSGAHLEPAYHQAHHREYVDRREHDGSHSGERAHVSRKHNGQHGRKAWRTSGNKRAGRAEGSHVQQNELH